MRGKLTDRAIRNWLAQAKRGQAKKKKSDGGGLYVTLTPAGTPVWRIKYRMDGTERVYAVGIYPEVGLKPARDERDRVKSWLREGRDPVQARHVERATRVASAEDTFGAITEVWLERQRKDWSSVHYTKSKRALERDVLPHLGKLPVSQITPAMVTAVIEGVMRRGARDTASKILQHVTGVFTLAQSKGMRNDNPAGPAQAALPKAKRSKGYPALLKFAELGTVLRSAEAARLSPAVHMAHRLCAFAPGARISNVVSAEWNEFDLEADVPTWLIPRGKMKARDRHHDHKVILAPQIAKELREWRKTVCSTGNLFPGRTGGKHITREALEKVYRATLALAGKHSPHSWRSAFSTLARDDEEGKFERDVVELTLDHIHDNEVVLAYDRGERLKQRIKLMAWWGEQLAQAQRGAEVTPIRRRA
jgi:integrase